jgi:hypothetical protein
MTPRTDRYGTLNPLFRVDTAGRRDSLASPCGVCQHMVPHAVYGPRPDSARPARADAVTEIDPTTGSPTLVPTRTATVPLRPSG